MKYVKIKKMLISSFLLGMYLFAVLFSQSFHEHGSADFFKGFSFKKVEKSIAATDNVTDFDQCLSCHFLHSAKTYSLQNFEFQLIDFQYLIHHSFAILESNSSTVFHQFYLRGPPFFI